MRRAWLWFGLGFVAVYVLKYVVFGLELWDMKLHPERLEADRNGPWKMFFKPFLGAAFQ